MHISAAPSLSLGRQIVAFGRHFLEMCIAMCVGGGILVGLIFVAAPAAIGFEDPRQRFPELSLLAIAAVYVVPMAFWMRFRGMAWRPILEMSGAALALAVVLAGLTWLGVISESGLRAFAPSFCVPACVVMVGAMLFRLDLYTGRTGHHMAHHLPEETHLGL